MTSDQLDLLAALASFNHEFQKRLCEVQVPEDILAIAADYGFAIPLPQLRDYSTRLNGDHWIWVRRGEAWRQRFFDEDKPQDLQVV